MIQRLLQSRLLDLATRYPILTLTGPRQSGKTTLSRMAFPDLPYVSLENPAQREFAQEDPVAFLARYGGGAIIDEVQRVPQIFSYLQGMVDEDPRPGRFLLTGSQNLALVDAVTQSLAGRTTLTELLPLSLDEVRRFPDPPEHLDTLLWQGGYPRIYELKLPAHEWLADYTATYVERDVRQLIKIGDLLLFQTFLRLCAGRTGQILNLASLASDCGISQPTARAWLSVLEASYIVHRLAPHHNNFTKRLVKTPKLYFYDPGLAAWLLGIEAAGELAIHSMRGPLFETWVVSELLKARFNQALTSNLFFWRDRSGHEVDVVIERGPILEPVEVKSGQTVTADFFTGLETWRGIAGEAAGPPWLVYGGDRRLRRSGVEVVPWREVGGVGQQFSAKVE